MAAFLPVSTSRRLVGAIAALLVLLLLTAGLALVHLQRIAATTASLATEDQERIELIAEVNNHANDSTRKLIVLLTAPRSKRVDAYAEIDAVVRHLNTAMQRLPRYVEGGASNPGYLSIVDKLRRYRQAYQDTADLIEADDMAAAQTMMVERTDADLAALIKAVQNLQHVEQQRLGQRTAALAAQLASDRRLLIGMGLVGLLVAAALALWIVRGVAAPLRATARAARQFAGGDYSERLPVRRADEVGDIAAAFNQLAEEVQQREAALRRLIDIDPLTGLAQRNRFLADHRQRAELATRGGPRIALLCFDIERLKSINALLGFDAGDAVIVEAARRAGGLAEAPGNVARLGGGTFAAVVELASGEAPVARGSAFRNALEHRITWRDHVLDISATVGMALCPDHGETLPELLRRAEQALFEAKRQRLSLAVYSPSIEAARLSHLSMVSELQQAIELGHLLPFLQPKLCLATGRIVGAEALVRWRHPERGMIPPVEFIPFAESTGRIAAVTTYMLEQCIALMQERVPGITVAVNVSTYDLRDADFPQRLRAMLARRGVAAERLQIEITESGLLDNGADPITRLAAVRDMGVKIAIDDFGTGQSSLAYLQRLPAHELKIDRSFVAEADASAARRELLSSIVRLGHGLGLVVTAEGVETQGELDMLREAGCDLAQGYFIAKPMPVDDFIEFMRNASSERPQGRAISSATPMGGNETGGGQALPPPARRL